MKHNIHTLQPTIIVRTPQKDVTFIRHTRLGLYYLSPYEISHIQLQWFISIHIKPKAKESSRTDPTFLFYILLKHAHGLYIFLRYITIHHFMTLN
jgi:hypothetical protein